MDQAVAIAVTVTPTALGPDQFELVFGSDAENLAELSLALQFEGVPPPAPHIEICDSDRPDATCSADLEVDFGTVRRTQSESRTIVVKNLGTAALEISDVIIEYGSSLPGEFSVLTSTRPGTLPVGEAAQLQVHYEPGDARADTLALTLTSNDPLFATSTITCRGTSAENDVPVAVAHESTSGATTAEWTAGTAVYIDGSDSSGPEGDPLRYQWRLVTPAASMAALSSEDQGAVFFVPDLAGIYRVELVVYDAIGQASKPATVQLLVAPEAALRIRSSWNAGGDVDLHLVEAGAALFSEQDCYFAEPRPDFGAMGDGADDPELLADAEEAPGVENLIYPLPPDGVYEIWLHYWDDRGAGSASVTTTITLFDSSFPAFEGEHVLHATCDAWHIGSVSFPDGLWMPVGPEPVPLCAPPG